MLGGIWKSLKLGGPRGVSASTWFYKTNKSVMPILSNKKQKN